MFSTELYNMGIEKHFSRKTRVRKVFKEASKQTACHRSINQLIYQSSKQTSKQARNKLARTQARKQARHQATGRGSKQENQCTKLCGRSSPPVPFRIAKALHPGLFRNVELDIVQEEKREARLRNLGLSSGFSPGDKCQAPVSEVRNNNNSRFRIARREVVNRDLTVNLNGFTSAASTNRNTFCRQEAANDSIQNAIVIDSDRITSPESLESHLRDTRRITGLMQAEMVER
ncbi:hypothetical protein PoB_005217600 [Plakobranchus ocellatus]|uniref:Uncharacterized protein n=1 Tax=Plakobranchus ocellatus TaxID=259542 RepID=A0AAV4BYR0_9GAST|nr:hypothetical protein PoB_005217600 [Plakobranchus ocellatus]